MPPERPPTNLSSQESIARLQELKEKFDVALAVALDSGDPTLALKLMEKLAPVVAALIREQPLDLSALLDQYRPFLKDTFKIWYRQAGAEKAKFDIASVPPADLDYVTYRQGRYKPGKFGQFTVNPDTQNLDLDKAKIFIPDLSDCEGQPLDLVAKHLVDTYSKTHLIPGLEYWQYLIEHPHAAPELQNSHCYFFFGSLLRDSDGSWGVPFAGWDRPEFRRGVFSLGDVWRSDCHVVLLEIPAS